MDPLADQVTDAKKKIFEFDCMSKNILSLSRHFHQFSSCIAVTDSEEAEGEGGRGSS